MLQIDIKSQSFSEKIVLQDIKIQIAENGLYGFVGKNGTGKTTFFKCLNHLVDFHGKILFQKEELSPRQVAFIPTEPPLYDHLSVKEFYSFFSKLIGVKNMQDILFQVDTNLLIRELSTGMRKKVYLNAVFQKKYDLYVFDEPFNGLDIESVYFLRKLLKELARHHIVFVSSHILETLQPCQRIFLLHQKRFKEFTNNEFDKIEEYLTYER